MAVDRWHQPEKCYYPPSTSIPDSPPGNGAEAEYSCHRRPTKPRPRFHWDSEFARLSLLTRVPNRGPSERREEAVNPGRPRCEAQSSDAPRRSESMDERNSPGCRLPPCLGVSIQIHHKKPLGLHTTCPYSPGPTQISFRNRGGTA